MKEEYSYFKIEEGSRLALIQIKNALSQIDNANPEKRVIAFTNIVVWGRSFTSIICRYRHWDKIKFEEWYAPHRTYLTNDQVFKELYNLRSKILKEGLIPHPSGFSMQVKELHLPIDLGQKPIGTKGSFVLDNLGGIGWIIETSPGVEEKIYVNLPSNKVTVDETLSKLTGPISIICKKYYKYLLKMQFEVLLLFRNDKQNNNEHWTIS